MPGTPTTSPPGPTNPQGALPFKGELRLIDNVLSQFDGTDWIPAVIPSGQLDPQPVYKDPVTGEVTLSNGLIVAGGATADALTVSGAAHLDGGVSVTGGLIADTLTAIAGADVTGGLNTDGVTSTGPVVGHGLNAGSGSVAGSGGANISGGVTVDSLSVSGGATVNGIVNAVTDAQVDGVPLPRGSTIRAFTTANTTGITTTAVNIIQLTQTLFSGRRYSIEAAGWAVGSSVANTDFYEIQLYDYHTSSFLDYWRGWCGPGVNGAYGSWKVKGWVTGDDAVHIISAQCLRMIGTGTLTAFAQTGHNTWMEITDVGT